MLIFTQTLNWGGNTQELNGNKKKISQCNSGNILIRFYFCFYEWELDKAFNCINVN